MVKKLKRTTNRTSKSTGSPTTTVRKEPTSQSAKKSKEEDEWGPLTSLAKKAAKGAVKGAAKELHKK
jgi:hypothetical protein